MLGSQNSSNSRRLAEIAQGLGVPSHLIDGVSEIQHSWFGNVETVLITAGASAPEQVVQECIDYLETNFGATIHEETVRTESVHFPLPKSLRQLLPAEPPSPLPDDFDVADEADAELSNAPVDGRGSYNRIAKMAMSKPSR